MKTGLIFSPVSVLRKVTYQLRYCDWFETNFCNAYLIAYMFLTCHPERQRRIFVPSTEKGFFVTTFLRMTYSR